jgi:hypothetical protein
MLDLASFTARFPEFSSLSQTRFDIFYGDAVMEMGDIIERWLYERFYDTAMAYLIAHFIAYADASSTGDTTPMVPLSKTDVDEVEVDYATSSHDAESIGISGAGLYTSTIYGQQYIKWRNQAFAGARVVSASYP